MKKTPPKVTKHRNKIKKKEIYLRRKGEPKMTTHQNANQISIEEEEKTKPQSDDNKNNLRYRLHVLIQDFFF